MKGCIVIGGNGFIGKYIVQELLNIGRKVTVFDIQNPSEYREGVEFINLLQLSEKELQDVINENDEIIDLAYSTNPKTSFDDPLKDIVENLENTVRIFALAVKNSTLRKFLYVSSGGAVYGDTKSKLINERHDTNPISPYGITKLAIEKYGLMFLQNKNLPFIAARPSNAYGPGQLPNRGQGFIAQSIYNILHKIPVDVFGKKGTVRDYIFVSDLAKGIVALLDKGKVGGIYNIGTGKGFSNVQIFKMLNILAKKDNIKAEIRFNPERKFDVNRNILNSQKIKNDCNWDHKINFEQGLKMVWDHFQNEIINQEK